MSISIAKASPGDRHCRHERDGRPGDRGRGHDHGAREPDRRQHGQLPAVRRERQRLHDPGRHRARRGDHAAGCERGDGERFAAHDAGRDLPLGRGVRRRRQQQRDRRRLRRCGRPAPSRRRRRRSAARRRRASWSATRSPILPRSLHASSRRRGRRSTSGCTAPTTRRARARRHRIARRALSGERRRRDLAAVHAAGRGYLPLEATYSGDANNTSVATACDGPGRAARKARASS